MLSSVQVCLQKPTRSLMAALLAPATASVRILNQSVLAAALQVARAKLGYAAGRDPAHVARLRTGPGREMSWAELEQVGLLSQTKPHVRTHRNGRELSTSVEDDICLCTGLCYRYFDSRANCFVVSSHETDIIPLACTYQLPSQSNALQKFIWRPAADPQGPSPNTVIASQSDCPAHFSLAEYKELCSIPLGLGLQWWDIAAQLTAPTINFQREETLFVVLQQVVDHAVQRHSSGSWGSSLSLKSM